MANLEITGTARPLINEIQTLTDSVVSLNNSYGEIQESGKKVFSDAADDAKALKTETKKLATEQNKYGDILKLIEKRVDSLYKGQQKATDTKSIKKYSQEIARAESAYRELEAAGVRSIKNVNNEANKSIPLFNNLRSAIVTAFAVTGLSLGAADFVGEVVAFEAAADELSSITGAVGDDLEFLKQQAIEVGTETTKSALDTVKAFQIIASEKPELLAAKEALAEVTREAVALSEASGLDLPAAAIALTGALNQFSAPADQASRFINVLAAGSQKGAVAIPLITDALLQFGTVADVANVSIEQSTALIEALGEKGIKGAEAGTKLRNFLSILQKGADDTNPAVVGLNKALENLEGKQLSVTDLTKKFGLENFVAAKILIDNRDRVEELTDAVTGTSTAYEQQAVTTENLQSSVARLRNVYSALIVSIEDGEGPIAQALKSAVDGFADFLRGIIENKEEVKRWLIIIGNAAKALGLLVIAIKSYQLTVKASTILTNGYAAAQKTYAAVTGTSAVATRGATVAQRALNLAMKANPVAVIVTAVLGLVAAYKLLTAQSKEQIETERLLTEGKEQLNKVVREERKESDTLFSIIRDGNATRDQQKKAIELVLEKYGPYLGTIDDETQLLGRLDEAQRRVNRGILEQAFARVKAQKIEEQTIALIEKQIEIQDAIQKAGGEAALAAIARSREAANETQTGGGRITRGSLASSRAAISAGQVARLQKEADDIASSIDKFSKTIDSSFESLVEKYDEIDFSTEFNSIDLEIKNSEQRLQILANQYDKGADLQKEAIQKEIQAEEQKLKRLEEIRSGKINSFLGNSGSNRNNFTSVDSETLTGGSSSSSSAAESIKKAADLERKKAELRIAAMADGIDKEIELEKFRFETLRDELMKFDISTEEAEEQHQINIASIREKYRVLEESERKAAADKEEREREEAIEAEKKALEERQQLEAARFEGRQQLEKNRFNAIARTEEEITDFTKDQEKERQLFILNQQKELLEKLVEFGAGRTELETEFFKQTIENIKAEIQGIQNGSIEASGKGGQSIFSLFGLNDETDSEAINGIKEATGILIDQLSNLADARVESANKAVEAKEREVSAAEEALNTEIQIANLGFASNVDLRRKELEDAKRAEQEAIEQRRKAVKEKLILDTVTQSASLITSSANIFQSLSTIPFVGVPLAIGIIATMFGAFAKAKATAFKAAKFRFGGDGEIGKDGFIKGKSHSQGGVKMEVEDGEFFRTDGSKFSVVRREMSKKHRGLLRAINEDNEPLMATYLDQLLEGTGVVKNNEFAQKIESKRNQNEQFLFNQNFALKSDELKSIDSKLEILVKSQTGNTWKVKDDSEKTVYTFGSVKKVVKK